MLHSEKESVRLEYLSCVSFFNHYIKMIFLCLGRIKTKHQIATMGIWGEAITGDFWQFLSFCCVACFLQLGKHFFCDCSCPKGKC